MDTFFDVTLSKQEWRKLFKFLKDTRNKNLLPKDADGYSGFNITTSKVQYYSLKADLAGLEWLTSSRAVVNLNAPLFSQPVVLD